MTYRPAESQNKHSASEQPEILHHDFALHSSAHDAPDSQDSISMWDDSSAPQEKPYLDSKIDGLESHSYQSQLQFKFNLPPLEVVSNPISAQDSEHTSQSIAENDIPAMQNDIPATQSDAPSSLAAPLLLVNPEYMPPKPDFSDNANYDYTEQSDRAYSQALEDDPSAPIASLDAADSKFRSEENSALAQENDFNRALDKQSEQAEYQAKHPHSHSKSSDIVEDNEDEIEDPFDETPPNQRDPKLFALAQKEGEMQIGRSFSRRFLPYAMIVLMLFAGGIGILVGSYIMNNLTATTEVLRYKEAIYKLNEVAGYFAYLGPEYSAVSTALWFMLSSMAGCLALIIPIDVYFTVARSNIKSANAGATVADLLKAEFYKYGLIILILGFLLKETDLYAPVVVGSFAVLSIVAMVLQLFTLPQPSPEFFKYMQKKKKHEKLRNTLAFLRDQDI